MFLLLSLIKPGAHKRGRKTILHTALNRGHTAHLGQISRCTLCYQFSQKTLEKISRPSYCSISILVIFPVVKHFMFIKVFEVYIK